MRFSPTILPAVVLSMITAVSAQANCVAVTFTLTATAQNRNITVANGLLGSITGTVFNDLLGVFSKAPIVTVSGEETLAATYCTATVLNANNGKIEVLSGSISEDRGGWQAQGGVGLDFPAYRPDLYSWVQYANAQGYNTLAIDRVGTGKSSHPDPILKLQAPYEEALLINLAEQIRAGAPQLGRAFDFIIYVGNSYGSQLGAGIAGQNHAAYDEYVLTGFTNTPLKGLAGVTLVIPAPAQLVDPARFGRLPLGYLTTSSQLGRTQAFFGLKAQVQYEDTVANLFFQRKDVVGIGEFLSIYADQFIGAGFTGRVLTLDGENDQPFCGLGSGILGPAFCGSQPKQTGVLFPDADYNYKTVNKIGHAVQLHTRSQVLFRVAHDFLNGASFAGGTPA